MPAPRNTSRNARIALGLALVVPAMVGLSFAAVPLYDLFCRVTGYGGTTSRAEAPLEAAGEEVVTVRFDSNIAPGFDVAFRPMQRTMQLKVGETGLAFYELENLSDEPIVSTATFNVTPFATGPYFDKIACFCFELQELGPREKVEMPVTFYVDPEMLDDAEAKGVRTITLSYTMFAADPPAPRREAAAGRIEPNTEIATAALPASPAQPDAAKAIAN